MPEAIQISSFTAKRKTYSRMRPTNWPLNLAAQKKKKSKRERLLEIIISGPVTKATIARIET